METICPLSNSPCSGVLKFRLASNASANVASAVSLLWVMDRKAFQWDGSLDGEIGWAAYLTRKSNAPGTEQRRRSCVSSADVFSRLRSSKKKFRDPLHVAKRGPTLRLPDAPDASSQMSTARRVVPERDGFRGCHADASLQLSTRGERLRRAKDVGTNVDSNALWWLLTDRERAREIRDREPFLFPVCYDSVRP